MNSQRFFFYILVILIFGTGCRETKEINLTSNPEETITSTSNPEETRTSISNTQTPPGLRPEKTQHQIEPSTTALPIPIVVVQRDLAEQLGVLLDDIEVKEVEEVQWPDTCLGIPAPELCARGETPGFRIILHVFNQDYVYHTDTDLMFRYAGPGDFPTKP